MLLFCVIAVQSYTFFYKYANFCDILLHFSLGLRSIYVKRNLKKVKKPKKVQPICILQKKAVPLQRILTIKV